MEPKATQMQQNDHLSDPNRLLLGALENHQFQATQGADPNDAKIAKSDLHKTPWEAQMEPKATQMEPNDANTS